MEQKELAYQLFVKIFDPNKLDNSDYIAKTSLRCVKLASKVIRQIDKDLENQIISKNSDGRQPPIGGGGGGPRQ